MQTMPAQLIVTRPAETGADFARKVQKAYGDAVPVILSPGLTVVPVSARFPASASDVVFTSMHGVMQAHRLAIPLSAQAWCVGNRTAEAARALGFSAYAGGGDVGQLLDAIIDAMPRGRIVHIAGQHTRGDVVGTLIGAGLDCQEVTAYDQQVTKPTSELVSALSGDKPVVIPLFSARSGIMLSQIEWRAPVHIVAMSNHIADVVLDWGADTIRIAQKMDEPAMIAATCQVLDQLKDGAAVT